MKRLKSVVLIITISAFFYSIFGLAAGSFIKGRFKIYGAMFDPNDIAYVLVSLFPFCFFYLVNREGILKKLLAAAGIAGSILVILYSASRGGLIGLAIVLALFLLTKVGNVRKSYKVAFLVIGLIIVSMNYGKIDIQRYLTLEDVGTDYNMTDEWGRVQIWKRAFGLLLSNPITGVGVTCSEMAIGYAREEAGLLQKWQSVHNSFIQVGVETGAIGLALFMVLIVMSLRSFSRAKKISGGSDEIMQFKTIAGLAQIAFIGDIVTAFFLTQGYSIFFTLFFALSAVMMDIAEQLTSQQETNEGVV